MINPYIIVLGFFVAAGFVTALWAWSKINKNRKSLHWPHTQGVVTESRVMSDLDPRPYILIQFKVNDEAHEFQLPTPDASDVTPEIGQRYLQQYPVNSQLEIFYNPEDPKQCTLRPGPAREDWLIFGIGLIATVFGLFLILPNL